MKPARLPKKPNARHHDCTRTHSPLSRQNELPRRKPGRLVPLGGLIGILILALGLAGALIPRQSELVKRLALDGQHDRALALVGQEMAEKNNGNAPVEATPASLVEVLLDSIDHDFDHASMDRISALVSLTDDPETFHSILRGRSSIIPQNLMAGLLDQLAKRAVQTGNPALAVQFYEEVSGISPLSHEQLEACITAARYSGQPARALDAVSHHLQANHTPFTQLPDHLRKLTIELHRELNHGSQAFDLLSEEFKATLEPAARKELVELITTVAAQSERLPDSLPILEEFVAGTPAGKTGWRSLANSKPEADQNEGTDFLKFGRTLAQHYEWNNRTDDAFDLYRKLAAMGDLSALDRCVTIYPWVDRQNDLTDLLEILAPVKEREKYTLLLARLQAERGQFSEAEKIYRTELAGTHDHDASLWSEFAAILDAQERFTEAREAYIKSLEIDPERHEARVRLARLHVSLGDYRAALAEYHQLPPEAHDRKTREDFAMIAKSLEEPRDFITAIHLKIDSGSITDPSTWLDLADAWENLDDLAAMEKSLNSGLEAFPQSAALLLRLSDHLVRSDRKTEAFNLLASSRRIEDMRFASRLIGLGYETGQFEETVALVEGRNIDWSPAERFDLASLYEETGDMQSALRHYRQAEGGEADTARIEAEIAYYAGDVNTALLKQKNFLDLLTEPDYEAWTFFGDLNQVAGRISEAEAAYQRALEQLKIQLSVAPETANEDPEVAVNR